MKLRDIRLSTRITISALIIVATGATVVARVENERLREVYLNERSSVLELNLITEELQLNQAIHTLRQDVLFLSNTPPVSGIVRAALNHGYDPARSKTNCNTLERLRCWDGKNRKAV